MGELVNGGAGVGDGPGAPGIKGFHYQGAWVSTP